MKKFSFIILLILLLCLCLSAFTACVRGDDQNGDTDDGNDDPAISGPPTDEEEKPTKKYDKVIIISGQSNAVGFSDRNLLKKKISEERFLKLSGPFENVKIISEVGKGLLDCENISLNTFENVTLGGGGLVSYHEDSFGPEVGIAETVSSVFKDETVYIIKAAFGGASLYRDFLSPSMADHISYDYKLLTDTIDGGLQALKNAGLNPKIVGFCWMQGEADASRDSQSEGHQDRYFDNLTKFVGDLRARYDKDSLNNKMNFIDAYIHDYFEFHKTVNDQKLRYSKKSENNYVINTLKPDLVEKGVIGLTAKYEPSVSITPVDPLHYDSTSMLKLGNMFGEKLLEILNNK